MMTAASDGCDDEVCKSYSDDGSANVGGSQ